MPVLLKVRVFFLLFADDVDGMTNTGHNDSETPTFPDEYVFPEIKEVAEKLRHKCNEEQLFEAELNPQYFRDYCRFSDNTAECWGEDVSAILTAQAQTNACNISQKLTENTSVLSVILHPSDRSDFVWKCVVEGVEKYWNKRSQTKRQHEIIRLHLEDYSSDCYSFPVKSCVPLYILRRNPETNSADVAAWIFNQIIMLLSARLQPCAESFLIGVLVELQEQHRMLLEDKCHPGFSETSHCWLEWTVMSSRLCNFCKRYLRFKKEPGSSPGQEYADRNIETPELDISSLGRNRTRTAVWMKALSRSIADLYRFRDPSLPPIDRNRRSFFTKSESDSVVEKADLLVGLSRESVDLCTLHLLRYEKFIKL